MTKDTLGAGAARISIQSCENPPNPRPHRKQITIALLPERPGSQPEAPATGYAAIRDRAFRACGSEPVLAEVLADADRIIACERRSYALRAARVSRMPSSRVQTGGAKSRKHQCATMCGAENWL